MIDLHWEDNSDNEEGFQVERKTGAGGVWSVIRQVGSDVTNFNNSGLDSATTYFYRVRAYNNVGDSGYSNEISATTENEVMLPPQLITPEANVTISAETVAFDWTDVEDAYEYYLQIGTDEEFGSAPIGISNFNSEASVNFEEIDWLPDGQYYWRAGARKEDIDWEDAAWSDGRVFQFERGTPSLRLLEPEDRARFDAISITFDWTDFEGAAFYGLQISPNIEFANVPIGLTNVTSDVTVNFRELDWFGDGTYYWRASAFEDGDEWEDATISDTRRFILDRNAGPTPGEEREFQLIENMNIMMVWIPPGNFMMGAQNGEQHSQENEFPRHRVDIENGYWMGKYELTQAQYEAVMGNNPAHDYGEGDNFPVYFASWESLQEFEAELDNQFRLPSEAEWEYACRAGTETRYYFGDDPNYVEIDDYTWHLRNSDNQAHEVGGLQPNDWGLYDMSGNVWEFCEDWYHGNYDDAPDDGSAWVNPPGNERITKGGSFADNLPSFCRSAIRGLGSPDGSGFANVGFRLVREAD